MANIDYEKFIKELGEVKTSQVEIIRKYLEEQCQDDAALKSAYRPEKINDCYDFIEKCIKKLPREGNCACIEYGIVFKLARDFYIEVLPTIPERSETEKKSDKVSEKSDDLQEKAGQADATETEAEKPENENAAKDDDGKEDSGAETEAKELENDNPDADIPDEQTNATETEAEKPENENAGKEDQNNSAVLNQEEGGETLDVGNEADEIMQIADVAVSEVAAACGRHGTEAEEPVKYDEDGNGLLFGF